jgi:hypothetical protein
MSSNYTTPSINLNSMSSNYTTPIKSRSDSSESTVTTVDFITSTVDNSYDNEDEDDGFRMIKTTLRKSHR